MFDSLVRITRRDVCCQTCTGTKNRADFFIGFQTLFSLSGFTRELSAPSDPSKESQAKVHFQRRTNFHPNDPHQEPKVLVNPVDLKKSFNKKRADGFFVFNSRKNRFGKLTKSKAQEVLPSLSTKGPTNRQKIKDEFYFLVKDTGLEMPKRKKTEFLPLLLAIWFFEYNWCQPHCPWFWPHVAPPWTPRGGEKSKKENQEVLVRIQPQTIHFQQLQLILTLYSELCFIFPSRYLWTIGLPLAYLALGGIYHPFRAAVSSNPTRPAQPIGR